MEAIFFDLDNTLYDTTSYFSLAFKQVAFYLSRRFLLSESLILDILWSIFYQKGSLYPKLFDDTLAALHLQPNNSLVRELVELFHEAHTSLIKLYEDVQEVLPRLATKYKLGLITNGNAKMQRRKVAALGLERLMTVIVYGDDIKSSKPETYVYKYALKSLAVSSQESLYVGDNPYVDFVGAKRIGMYTIRVLRGEFALIQANREHIDVEVNNFYELECWLQNLEAGSRI